MLCMSHAKMLICHMCHFVHVLSVIFGMSNVHILIYVHTNTYIYIIYVYIYMYIYMYNLNMHIDLDGWIVTSTIQVVVGRSLARVSGLRYNCMACPACLAVSRPVAQEE